MLWYRCIYRVYVTCALVSVYLSCQGNVCSGIGVSVVSRRLVLWYQCIYHVSVTCALISVYVSCPGDVCSSISVSIMSRRRLLCYQHELFSLAFGHLHTIPQFLESSPHIHVIYAITHTSEKKPIKYERHNNFT